MKICLNYYIVVTPLSFQSPGATTNQENYRGRSRVVDYAGTSSCLLTAPTLLTTRHSR